MIFDDIKPYSTQVCIAISSLLKDYLAHTSRSKLRIIGKSSVLNYPVGFFDGASTYGSYGAGFSLCIGLSHFFHVKIGCGKGTNTRVELLALWGISHIA